MSYQRVGMSIIACLAMVAGVAAASEGHVPAAVAHAADKAAEFASDHSVFHRDAGSKAADEASADRLCDEWDNHGEYVSHVANETREETDHADDNDTGSDNESKKDHDANETRSHNATDGKPADDDAERGAHGEAVSEAAQSDIGKCGGNGGGDDSPEDDHGSSEDADNETEASEHGRSGEQRAEHPPRNGGH